MDKFHHIASLQLISLSNKRCPNAGCDKEREFVNDLEATEIINKQETTISVSPS